MDQSISALLVASLTSLFTLLGVYIANRHNSKENQKRLEFEMEDRRIQRLQEMRKEVYLTTAVDLIKLNSLISGMISDPDKRKDNGALESAIANLNKLNVVSSSNISLQATTVSQEYGVLVMDILLATPHLHAIEGKRALYSQYIEENQLELNGYVAQLNKLALQKPFSPKNYDEIESLRVSCAELNEKLFEKYSSINEHLNSERLSLLKVVVSKMKVIQPEVNKLMNLLRQEIGLDKIDLNELKKLEKINPDELIDRFSAK